MAFVNPPLGFNRVPADGKLTAFFDGDNDDPAVLDPAALEADIMQSPPSAVTFRKDSFANSNGVLSPPDSHAWDHHQPGALPIDPAGAAAQGPYYDDNNGFVRPGAPRQHAQPPIFGHPVPGPAWAFEHASGNCTPTAPVELMPPPPAFESVSYSHARPEATHATYMSGPQVPHHTFHVPHGEPGFIPAPQVQTPMSPHSHQDWMGMAQQEMERRPLPKRMRPNSPPTMVDLARRDGIRKKNGRIDIPSERNINTIDELIDKATDEDLIKELKQQKRLLRNREAALASRQRKKKHTEDLEVKEKGYTQQIAMLEKELSDLAIDQQRREEERRQMINQLHESHRMIEGLQEDIRNLKLQHNEETSNLRRKINVLTDQLTNDTAPAMSAAPSSTGFTDFNAEMEALNMGSHEWDDFFLVDNLAPQTPDDALFGPRPDTVKQSPTLEKRPSSSTVIAAPSKRSSDSTTEQPIASGLLFMLLLCGAFVLSKPATSRPSDLPRMPPEVQAAAPTVLNNLLAEAGASTQPSTPARTMQQVGREPQPSMQASHNPRTNSRLDRIHNRLTSPTKQQEIDQAFSLTTAQYASISQVDYSTYDEQQDTNTHRPRRTLADALANMQQANPPSSKAEVYTRSLLWDQIPADVVKQFKEIVRDHEEIEARQKKRSGQGYKAEP